MNIVKNKPNNYSNKILLIIKSIFILKNFFSQVIATTTFLEKILILQHRKNFFDFSFSTTFKSALSLDKSLYKSFNRKNNAFNKKISDSFWTKSLFKSFLNVNTWIPSTTVKVHPTFNVFYLYDNDSGVGFFNLKRLFQAWNRIIIFITNIFFYNLNYLVFGSSYFKYEVLSLNWASTNFTKFLWRFSHPFMFFLRNKTTFYNKLYFNYLNYLEYKIAFIIDINYHRRTIYYFNRNWAITIGSVPISNNFYTLAITLPASSNLNFSNLFFIRLLLKLKKNNSKLILENYKQKWSR